MAEGTDCDKPLCRWQTGLTVLHCARASFSAQRPWLTVAQEKGTKTEKMCAVQREKSLQQHPDGQI